MRREEGGRGEEGGRRKGEEGNRQRKEGEKNLQTRNG